MSRGVTSADHDLAREVYAIFGILVDAVDMDTAVDLVRRAVARGEPFLISTPNLNYLTQSQSDPMFKEALLRSDLCTADGMPIVWLSRLFGSPIKERVAGSSLFEAMKSHRGSERIRVFLLGGEDGSAERACARVNEAKTGLVCVGWHNPGFVDLDLMGSADMIAKINSSNADFLSVSIGAKKGQAWLLKHHSALNVPVRAYLGATINFETGDVKRAPQALQRSGLEWLWRTIQEPKLASRYWRDGWTFLRLLFLRALPLLAQAWILSLLHKNNGLSVDAKRLDGGIVWTLRGSAVAANVATAMATFRRSIAQPGPISIDMAQVVQIDSRFTGLLLMLKKAEQQRPVSVINASPSVEFTLRHNGFGELLKK